MESINVALKLLPTSIYSGISKPDEVGESRHQHPFTAVCNRGYRYYVGIFSFAIFIFLNHCVWPLYGKAFTFTLTAKV